jgi:hypothetical protein
MADQVDAPMIFPAMLAVMADVKAIEKGRRNEQQGFNFRGIEDILNELHDICARHGVFALPQVQERDATHRQTRNNATLWTEHHRVRYTFWAEDGSHVEAEVWGEGTDSADKATAKAYTSAFKTLLIQAFQIPTADAEDPDRAAEESKPAARQATERPQTQGQLLAQAAARAGFKASKDDDAEARKKIDEARRDVLQAAIGVRSTKDITKAHDVKKALDAFDGIAAKRLELAYEPDGTPILQAKTAPAPSGCAHPWPWTKTGRCIYCPSCGERLYQGDLPKNAEEAAATLAVLDAVTAKAASS